METTAVRQLLRSICLDLRWEYAVFWRFKPQNRGFLAWEDGYCDYLCTRASAESKSRNVGCGQEGWMASSSCCDVSIDSRSGDGYTVGAAVASMACLMYSLGEGTVGRVASTENHCWVFSDDFDENMFTEYPEEWQLQFAVGIKTILLVPVAPLGVVQLGSLEKVKKDTKIVADIKHMFNTLHLDTDMCMPSILSNDHQGQSTFSPRSLVKKIEPSDVTTDFINPIPSVPVVKRDHATLDYVQISKDSVSTVNPDIRSQLTEQDSLLMYANSAGMSGTAGGDFSPDLSAVSFSQCQPSYVSHLQLSDISNFLLQEEVSVSSPSNHTSLGFDFDTDMNMNLWSSSELIDLPFGEEIYNDYESVCGILTFPTEHELTSAFVPPIEEWCNEYVTEASIVDEVCSISGLFCHTSFIGGFESPIREFNGFSDDIITEDLLDAVVASALTVSSDTASGRVNSVRSSTTSCGLSSSSRQTQGKPQPDHLVGDSGQCGCEITSFADDQKVPESCVFEYSLKSAVTVQIDEMQNKKLHSKGGSKPPVNGKRKSKVGDIKKHRPRDRQMIQDRVRELRELVPNGAKCSIDSLLDRTAKHMLYLRNVTSQAKKVKQHVNRKVDGRKNSESSETPSHHNTRDRRFELGHQLGACPVIIEDLDHPRQMLIEVLCEDYKLFLEIAQVLRNSDLTILKGVTEERSNKMLAHFVVEVSTGFNRMDIFWPLMSLLKLCNPAPTVY
ncbi:hypothetical protein MKW94_018873 [Papaver nudicaule]|uniref:BHLH domain-containing protein n=1 Tax=Papaver nudicaule TaxID=74823 RepID=A0AA41UXN3_PAPNU|nr:hypothetical protein [Papaver nudicaule]